MEWQLLPLLLIPGVLAVTVHEIAHGWVALQLGDHTAANEGRLSLNPVRHIDPVGTLLVPVVLYTGGELLFGHGIPFGWAKPVPVTWRKLAPVRPGIAAVAAAGPSANLLMLMGWVLIGLIAKHIPIPSQALFYMVEAGIYFNAAIMMINLVPIPPLDGSRIVTALLPARAAVIYNRLERFGLVLIVILLFSGILKQLMLPVMDAVEGLIRLFGL